MVNNYLFSIKIFLEKKKLIDTFDTNLQIILR